MTEPCCRAAAIQVRPNARTSWRLLKATALTALLGMGVAWVAYLFGLINGDLFASGLSFGLAVIVGAPVWAAVLLVGLCWADARRWDREHGGECGDRQ
ncbi:hypothetical protein NDR87_18935 [Nocardia sp. CDC159]|uniref:Uncharacterized protein n=1 Tax=Nocardia pulmonis TaxID=2951408 RepID=A0A9X2EDI0_9NOCA|nr:MULTISPECIES: hypothetical protein [Nocardia]MCM6776233.1 hypothetical protein [Nocardia pulmonis]MCM6788441.1 hypothetical protein [Nocardia sp. CDC159]